jgi:hypothetical protein
MDIRRWRPEFYQRQVFDEIDKKFAVCLWDGQPLPKNLKYYCSGSCKEEMKKRRLYGLEDAIKKQLSI